MLSLGAMDNTILYVLQQGLPLHLQTVASTKQSVAKGGSLYTGEGRK